MEALQLGASGEAAFAFMFLFSREETQERGGGEGWQNEHPRCHAISVHCGGVLAVERKLTGCGIGPAFWHRG